MATIMVMVMVTVNYLIKVIHEIEGQGGDNEEEEPMIHRCGEVTFQKMLKTFCKIDFQISPISEDAENIVRRASRI